MRKKHVTKLIASVLSVALLLSGCTNKSHETEPVEQVEPTVTEQTVTPQAQDTEVVEEEPEVEKPPEGLGVNMIANGDFHDGLENWNTYLNHGGTCDFTADNEQGNISIQKTGSTDYGVQIYYDGFKLDEGGVYEFSFDLDTTLEREIEVRLQVNGGDYHI